MPLVLLGLGSAWLGGQIDDWIEKLTGEKPTQTPASGWTPMKVAFVASAAVFVGLGVKKLLEK